MAYDSHRGVTVLFGGWQTNAAGDLVTLNDMWEWNGTVWTLRMPHSATEGWTADGFYPTFQGRPVQRAHHNLVYDSARRRLVLFGGEARKGFQLFLNDIWEWDGTEWHFRTTNGPVRRSYAAMAYDPDRAVSVMTGGFLNGPNPTPGAVWEWDGLEWNMKTPTNGPATNVSQDVGGMAYDSARRLTLFGPAARWEFWTWDSSQWTRHEQFVLELWALQYGDLVFDRFRNRGVWFGGIYGDVTNTTGFFDGEKWEVMTNSAAYPPPPSRAHHAMAYDSIRRATVLFGGSDYSRLKSMGDTWELISVDTEPPQVLCPAGMVVDANRPCGARVEFLAFATDNCGGPVSSSFNPPPGSVFPPGDTLVTCTATDTAGNAAQCTFTVTVRPGPPFPEPVITRVSPQYIGLPNGMRVGTQITLHGRNFTIDDEVLVGGQPLLYPVFVSSVEIQGQTPGLAAGFHSVEIRRCGQFAARLDGAVQAISIPVITGTSDRTAYAGGGNLITVTGAYFTADTKIRIGFSAADGTANFLRNVTVSADGTTITGEVPPLPANELLGPRTLIAENSLGSTVLQRGVTYLPNVLERDPQILSLRTLQAVTAKPVDLAWHNGFPSALSARVQAAGTTPEQRARSFVGAYRDLLRLQQPELELVVRTVNRGILDNVKMAQNYRGVPVYGGEIVATLDGTEFVALTGNLLPLSELEQRGFNVNPTLTAEQAIAVVKAAENIDLAREALEPAFELMIYDHSIFAEAERDPRLVWRVTMNRSAYITFVDAHTGVIVSREPVAHSHGDDLEGFNFDLVDAEGQANAKDDNCFHWSDDVDVADEDSWNTDYAGNRDAELANLYARDCWAWFHRVLFWHSFDGDGTELEVFIQTTMNPGNVAQWVRGCDLIQFAYGAVDYEVMVHEFTHGVINSTSQLKYMYESGALNEHYADMMAILADRDRGELEIDPRPPINWTIGENRRPPQSTGIVRDFQNPTVTGQPAHWTNRTNLNVTPPNEANDYGGVHSNSGIANKAAYLMIEGGVFNGYLVRGMGAPKVRHLKFNALRSLPDSATFQGARIYEIAAAESFAKTGENGFTSQDVCTVRNAWAAVGVGMGDSNCDGIEDDRHDLDGDLIPNLIDNCPTVANPDQANPDRDGYGNACDNCDFVPNDGQEDYDFDGIGDPCDPDRDGDGCLNDRDQDPNSDQHRIGTSFSATCPERNTPFYGFAGGNSDYQFTIPPVGDKADCEDLDDDNDGIPDFGLDGIPGTADDDPCPVGPLRNAISGECGVIGRDCPVSPKDWWQTCLGGGCVQFYARILDKVNPDPTRETVVDNIRIVNQTLYMAPNTGATLANTARAIANVNVGPLGKQGPEDTGLRRIEIWQRATATEPAHLIAVVGDFDPAALQLGQTTLGSLLAFTPGASNQPPTLAATWHVGADPASAAQDNDADGLPDGWEIRHGLNPHDAQDAARDDDGDGMSNAAEFLAGTNPASATSRVAILGATLSAGQFHIQFVGPAGRRVQLERAEGLTVGQWSPMGSTVRLQGASTTLTDQPPPSREQGFYRVRVLPD